MKSTPFDRIASDCMARKIKFPENLAKQYVRILQKINESWGLPACRLYLDELIMPSRAGRQGFPPEVMSELIGLKQLHEYVYPVKEPHIWDPYYQLHRERFKESHTQEGEQAALLKPTVSGKPRPSVYKSWFSSSASRNFRNSPIGSLYPSKGLTKRRTNPTDDEMANAAVLEILEDAEDMLDIRRMHSATALYEEAILRMPTYSAYPHLRLLEIYYDTDHRPGFERVARRFGEHFDVGTVRWVLVKSEFWSQLDKIASALLKKTSSQSAA